MKGASILVVTAIAMAGIGRSKKKKGFCFIKLLLYVVFGFFPVGILIILIILRFVFLGPYLLLTNIIGLPELPAIIITGLLLITITMTIMVPIARRAKRKNKERKERLKRIWLLDQMKKVLDGDIVESEEEPKDLEKWFESWDHFDNDKNRKF